MWGKSIAVAWCLLWWGSRSGASQQQDNVQKPMLDQEQSENPGSLGSREELETCSQWPPPWPAKFSAVLTKTAHLLDSSKEYPPSITTMNVYYDLEAGMARATILYGLDANKTFIRRYDLKNEYMIREGKYPACRRSYLGEPIPQPAYPLSAVLQERETISDGTQCNHWLHEGNGQRVHIWIRANDSVPRRLTVESVESDESSSPIMSYDFTDWNSRPQLQAMFELFGGYTHETCERHVGGWPYLHLFYHYFRF